MGYSLWLEDKETEQMCRRKEPEVDLGNVLCIGGSDLMEFNITYNYKPYYHNTKGFEKDGIRTIYGLTGKESLPLLKRLAEDIENNFKKDGKWIKTRVKQRIPYCCGKELSLAEALLIINKDAKVEYIEKTVERDEGSDEDYWEPTAKNALKAVQSLIKMAEECPEGVWNGD